jgi:SAM-dependent methyltransferase
VNEHIDYWDDVAATASFTHPLNESWIKEHGDPATAVLDYGCGYGRMLSVAERLGFESLFGVDPSAAMIERARSACPRAQFSILEAGDASTGLSPSSVGLALLVAVLTCIPDEETQHAIVDEIERILIPSGLLYVSDFLLQKDTRNLVRYAKFEGKGLPYGVFEIDDGRTSMRHHDGDYLLGLFSEFEIVAREEFSLETMKGNPAVGTRLLLRKPA